MAILALYIYNLFHHNFKNIKKITNKQTIKRYKNTSTKHEYANKIKLAQHLTQKVFPKKVFRFTIPNNEPTLPASDQLFHRMYAKMFTDFAVWVFGHSCKYFIHWLIYANCNACLLAEFVGRISVPYKWICINISIWLTPTALWVAKIMKVFCNDAP